MPWSNSKIFRAYIGDVLTGTSLMKIQNGGDGNIKVALFPDTITPNQDVSATASQFGAGGVWTAYAGGTGAEKVDVTNWVTGGRVLASNANRKIDYTSVANTVFFDADDLAGGGNVTLSAVFGCLVYDDTIATPVVDQGVCYNYFGGTQGVTAGTFTIVWHANGIWRLTL